MEFHLMIIDDEATIRKGLSNFIDWFSIDCIVDATACDGAEAIEKLSLYPIDIIITDIKMPEADGIAVAKYVHEYFPDIKVIILTGYADFCYAQTAIQYNVVDFLLKPTSKDQLIHAVQNAQQKILTSKTYSSMAEEEISFLKDRLLLELTDNCADRSIQARLSHYQFTLDNYYIAAFELLSKEDDINVLKEIVVKQTHSSYSYRYNKLILTVYYVESTQSASQIAAYCNEIIDFASSLYAMDVSAGISRHHLNAEEFSTAASEAIHALSLNFYSTDNVACYSVKGSPESYLLTTEDTLCLYEVENCLNTWKFQSALSLIDSMFTRLTANFAKSVDIKSICSQIYYICSRVLMKKDLPPPSTDYLTNLYLASSILQLEDLTHELLLILEQQLTFSGKKYSSMIENAVQYIHEKLSSPLSLEVISGFIHVNPSHLSRTFKKESGYSLTEYINMARVEKAKDLLSSPSVLTYEISEMTGFNDPAYFSSIFKKYTGLSPKEYRQKVL